MRSSRQRHLMKCIFWIRNCNLSLKTPFLKVDRISFGLTFFKNKQIQFVVGSQGKDILWFCLHFYKPFITHNPHRVAADFKIVTNCEGTVSKL